MFNQNECVHCHARLNDGAEFCTKCGTPAPKCQENRCENLNCVRCNEDYLFGPDDLYCDKCGKPTTLGKKIETLI